MANDDPGSFGDQEQALEQLEGYMNNRYLALHVEYRSWSDLTASKLANDASIQADLKYGRVPVISLHCADNMTGNGGPYDIVGIANGNAHRDLAIIKGGLATLKYADKTPYPIMLRWFWEFNVNAKWPMPSPAPNNNDCYEQPGANNSPPNLPTQFINAWTHIHNYFDPVGGGGDPDVTFVWNPAVDDASPWSQPPSPGPFYPGNSQVDWIGVDGYDTELNNPPNYTPLGFDAIFRSFVGAYSSSSYGKPIIIGENASCQEYVDPNDQATYLENADGWLDNQMEDENNYYSDVHAYAYFDTTASAYTPYNYIKCTWLLDTSAQPPQTLSGQQEFINMSADSNFAPTVTEP